MKEILKFMFEGHNLRTVVDNRTREVWFMAKDVATALGYTNTRQAVRLHCKKQVIFQDLLGGAGDYFKPLNDPNVKKLTHEGGKNLQNGGAGATRQPLNSSNVKNTPHKKVKDTEDDDVSTDDEISEKALLIKDTDLFRLVMRSTRPYAEKYQDWVFEDVLPPNLQNREVRTGRKRSSSPQSHRRSN